MTLPTHEVSFGFGYPPGTALDDIVWTTPPNKVEYFDTNRGRTDETSELATGTATLRLSNRGRWFDPSFSDLNYLRTTGALNSFASTPDIAAYDVAGDQWGRWFGRLADYTPTVDATFLGRYTGAGVDRLWRFRLTTTGFLQLVWFEAGGTLRTATSSVGTSWADDTDAGFAFTLDVNDAGSFRVKFFTSTDGVNWTTQLGADRTGTATDVRTGAADLAVNGVAGANEWANGRCYFADYGSGLTLGSSALASPQFRYAYAAPLTFTDDASRVWTVTTPASIPEVSYFPHIKPMTPIRIRETHDSTTRDIFVGWVTDWPQEYGPPEDATVTISCVDDLERLGNAPLPRSVWVVEHDRNNPKPLVWWALDESTGVVAQNSREAFAEDGVGQWSGGTLGVSSLVPYDPTGRAASWDGVDDSLSRSTRVHTGLSVYWVAFWISTTATSGTIADHGTFRYRLILSSGCLRLEIASGNAWTTAIPINDGEAHYVVVNFTGSPEFFVDGVEYAASSSVFSLPNDTNIWLTVGNERFNTLPLEATIDEFMLFGGSPGSEFDLAEVEERYSWGVAPWDGDTTGERVDKILTLIGHPSADREVDTGVSLMGPVELPDNALAAIQAAASAEAGVFFIGKDGKAVFRDRHYSILNDTVVATLGEDPTLNEIQVEPDLRYRYGRDLIRNSITGRRRGGADLSPSVDEDSIALYGLRRYDVGEIDVQEESDVRARMDWTLDHYKDPLLRAETVVVKALEGSTDELWAFVLDAEIGQRVILKRWPQQVGDAIETEMIIEGVAHECEGTEWTTTLQLSPADTREYWILDTSELDSETRLAY